MEDWLKEKMDEVTGANEHNLERERPFLGQPHTDKGERGKQEVSGITMRDVRDCYLRAVFLSAGHIDELRYNEACKGEDAALCDNDLYEIDWNELDPVAIQQNLTCEIERVMGIFPNVPGLKKSTQPRRTATMTNRTESCTPEERRFLDMMHRSALTTAVLGLRDLTLNFDTPMKEDMDPYHVMMAFYAARRTARSDRD